MSLFFRVNEASVVNCQVLGNPSRDCLNDSRGISDFWCKSDKFILGNCVVYNEN